MSGPHPPGWKRMRQFPTVRIRDDSGRTVKAERITCGECGKFSHHWRRGNQDSALWFQRHGWHVGNNENHDRCEACTAFAKRKVIKMSDHKKPEATSTPVAATPVASDGLMKPADRRIISRDIESHWDEQNACYQMGWSDAKQATALGVPVHWVSEVRQLDFGGSGDDPSIATFIANQIEVKRDTAALSTALAMTQAKLKETTAQTTEMARQIDGYRNTERRLIDRVEALEEIAQNLGIARPVIRRA